MTTIQRRHYPTTNHHPGRRPLVHLRGRFLCAGWLAVIFFVGAGGLIAKTVTVEVAPGHALIFSPAHVSIDPGDTVKWVWLTSGHSVTSGTPDKQTSMFNSNILNNGETFSFTFPDPGTFPYFCLPHGGCCGMVGSVTVAGAPPPPSAAQLLNISTRMLVQTGDNVLIGGFIVTGNDPKKVIVRAIAPSLPVPGKLADPTLELVGPSGPIASNDNWMDAPNKQAIIDSSLPPPNDLESAILTTLPAHGAGYTAIVRGVGDTTGVALIEVYDLDQPADSQLANISTRGNVKTDSDVMIGGFILGPDGTGAANVLIRALGPSLADAGVSGVLANPVLDLHDANGTLVMTNDNWKSSQQTEIEAAGLPPSNDLESAMIVSLPAAPHTAIVSGKNGGTGVGLVEVYRLP